MDDNARPHRTLAVEEMLKSEDITRIDWPAYSPDLNPIEHVWDALGRRIAERLHYLENTKQLKQLLIEEWALLPQEMLHQLDLSMRRRCEEAIAKERQREEATVPGTSRHNLRPRRTERNEFRLSSEQIEDHRGPIRSRGRRAQPYRPYHKNPGCKQQSTSQSRQETKGERSSSQNSRSRRSQQQQRQEMRRASNSKRSQSLEVLAEDFIYRTH
ncbi:transposable element Tcb2 transposase [Trichonephila clavipes]|nr:transposable element Tcb2 transposase [Trichonephila clavipes]